MSRRELIERVVTELASYERPSASDGERRAAEWLAGELREAGCRDVRVEEERAHGGYWWPLGLLNAGAALAALVGGRRVAALAGAVAAAAVYDDVSGGRLWFRRRVLPHRPTHNVVAEAGDPDAERTIVFVAHHDAAHSGLIFHPALPRAAMKRMPRLHAKADQSVPILFGVFLGPLLLALWGLLGLRLLRAAGLFFSVGAGAVMANIGTSRVVPGANDNLSAVATVVALAHHLREHRPRGVRVLLLSTGSEESFMEGMQASAAATSRTSTAQHRVRLPRVRGLPGALRGGGGGDAEDALVHGRLPRAAGPRGRGRRGAPAARPAHRGGHRRAHLTACRLPHLHSRRGGRHEVPLQLPLAHGHAREPQLVEHRGCHRGVRGVRARPRAAARGGSGLGRLRGAASARPSPNSGRSRIPSRVCHLSKLSCMASISSRMKRGDRFTRETTTPGTSPSSTSWSTRAKVMVNS